MIFLIISAVLLAACNTTKHSARHTESESSRADSLQSELAKATEQNELLQKTLHETIVQYEAERSRWDSLGVSFYPVDCPDSAVTVPTPQIDFDDGKIKSIRGPVKSVNLKSQQTEKELAQARETVDSIKYQLSQRDAEIARLRAVQTETASAGQTVVTDKQTRPASWLFWLGLGVGVVGTWLLKAYVLRWLQGLKKALSKFNLYE